jgi:DNA gyrase subunit A
MEEDQIKKTKYGQIKDVRLTEEMQRFYLDYAMSVIVARALPDVRDGLKPVHRRLLYAMHKMGLHFPAKYTKSAKIVGETMGKFHPHGDGPIYNSLVRLAQNFSMRYPLVDGQGNFGSMDGDPPAAMRYTEARLAKVSNELLADIEKETVDFVDNFDGSLQEPAYLPAKLPNLLLAGSDGIAVGMATKIPPHNLGEVIDAIVYMIDKSTATYTDSAKAQHSEPEKDLFVEQKYLDVLKKDLILKNEVVVDDLLRFIKGPDFPTGGQIFNFEEIRQAYATGKGTIVVRAKANIEDIGGNKSAIIVTELPFQVNKANLVAKIALLVRDKRITDIADLRDESDRKGVRVYIELKRGAVPKKALNNLYKLTELQTSFPVNIVGLVGKTPQTLTLKRILEEFITHRHIVIKRRSIYELRVAKRRAHILEGLKIAVDNIDEIIELIKKAKDVDDARAKLMARFKLSQIQSQAILDMRLKRLSALERQKIEDEYKILAETIAYLEDLLVNPEKILGIIKEEQLYLKEKYADKRRTKVFKQKAGEFSDEDLISNKETIVTITNDGYIKRVPIGTFRVQRRGGKGVSGMKTKEEDSIDKIFSCQTHDWIMFFTTRGRVFQTRVWELPEGSRQSKGKAVVNLIAAETGEEVTSILTCSPKRATADKSFIFMATKLGTVKKTALNQFKNIRSSGLIAIKLTKGDELRWATITKGNNNIMLISRNGMSIRFSEKDVRPLSRATMGVRGMKLKKGDEVVTMESFSPKQERPADKRKKVFRDILVISEKGIGKRTQTTKFNIQKRGGVGVKAVKVNLKTGKLVAALKVDQNSSQVVITSKKGQVIKLPIKNIPQLGRNTQGVILMRFAKIGDKAVSATILDK